MFNFQMTWLTRMREWQNIAKPPLLVEKRERLNKISQFSYSINGCDNICDRLCLSFELPSWDQWGKWDVLFWRPAWCQSETRWLPESRNEWFCRAWTTPKTRPDAPLGLKAFPSFRARPGGNRPASILWTFRPVDDHNDDEEGEELHKRICRL